MKKPLLINVFVIYPLLILFLILDPIPVFSESEVDGFFQQISYIANGGSDVNGLGIIHKIRYVIISPFIFIEEVVVIGIYINTIILIFCINLLSKKILKLKINSDYIVGIVSLSPFFFSFRTSLLFISMLMLYLFLTSKRHYLTAVVGFFLSFLSSGTVLTYILMCFVKIVKMKGVSAVKKISFIFLVFVMFLFFLPSLMHKIQFFTEAEGGNLIFSMLDRANIPVAIQAGNIKVVFVYVFSCLLGVFGLYRAKYVDRVLILIFIVSALTMEGLGSTSLIPLIIILSLSKFRFKDNSVNT